MREFAHWPPIMIPFGYLAIKTSEQQNFMTSMIKSDWDLTLFFVRPISAILGGLTIIVWFFPILVAFLEKAKKRNQASVQ